MQHRTSARGGAGAAAWASSGKSRVRRRATGLFLCQGRSAAAGTEQRCFGARLCGAGSDHCCVWHCSSPALGLGTISVGAICSEDPVLPTSPCRLFCQPVPLRCAPPRTNEHRSVSVVSNALTFFPEADGIIKQHEESRRSLQRAAGMLCTLSFSASCSAGSVRLG